MKKSELKQLIKEELIKEKLIKEIRIKKRTPEDVANSLKQLFQRAYETGLETNKSYDDFDTECWNGMKQDIVWKLEDSMK